MKQASASIYKNRIYFVAAGKTVSWLWITISPVNVFEVTISEEDLGNEVNRILDSTQLDIPDPDPRTYKNPILEATGVKSWTTLAKNSTEVMIEKENGILTFTPSKWGGKNEGVLMLDEKAITLDSEDPEEIGKILRQAFDLCE